MKFHSNLILVILAFTFSSAVAQGFVGFPMTENSNENPNEELIRIDANAMFDRYLSEHFAPNEFSLPEKTVVILIPQTGCHYCINKTINFYQQNHSNYAKLQIAFAGLPEEIDDSKFIVEKKWVDKGNSSKKYGFGAFPVIAYLENDKTIELVQVESGSVDDQLTKALAYLEGE